MGIHPQDSPGYQQSNCKAESAVKVEKRLMQKAKTAGQYPYLALLDHPNTHTHATHQPCPDIAMQTNENTSSNQRQSVTAKSDQQQIRTERDNQNITT